MPEAPDYMGDKPWHCECLHCRTRYYEPITVTHNAGYDWADTSAFCPNPDCGLPNESSSDYAMHDGLIPSA